MSSSMNDAVLIIPVYNEGTVIRKVVEEAKKVFPLVVCIDDGSTDNSIEQIERTGAILLKHPINMGQGAALQTGIEFARTLPGVNYFVTFDADGQHCIKDAASMVKKIKEEKVDIIFGSRFIGKTENMSRVKGVVLKLATWFSNITSGLRLTDTHNGLRVFNKHVACTMNITVPDMAHASEILEITSKNKYKYTEFPVTIRYTDYSKSKGQSLVNAINIGFDILLRKILR